MVSIKLTQTGTKNRKKYRIVVIEKRERRDGAAVEILGYYNPIMHPAELKFDMDRVKYWISKGAQPTDSIKKLLKLA